jgi:protein gp37
MSDLFLPEEYVSDTHLHRIFDVIEECPQHAFQALTKHGTEHANRMLVWDRKYNRWPDNLWMGVSVESANRLYRIEHLQATAASTKWVSFEPLVERLGISAVDLEGIDWVVIGGESGSKADRREMDHAWAREIRDAAKDLDIPVFFKQSSAAYPERGRRLAEEGPSLTEADSLGAETTEYRELPELPPSLREARPELREQEVVARVA